tara:strand:- start:10053 stop:11312 length:1260 start_codon:yes stop_codon:yes gene_type:complete
MNKLRFMKFDKIIAMNTSSLFFIYFINFLTSLLILPKLISIFGIRIWGEITFLQIILNYFIWIIDWSFPQFACKLISINENNYKTQQEIFTKTRSSQFILFLISSFLIAFICIFFIKYYPFYIVGNLILFGSFLQPYWYFNGKEKIYESALLQLFNKLTFAILIFSPIITNKIYIYFLILGISNLITGIFCTIILKYKYKLNLKLKNINESFLFIKESLTLFISSIVGNITTSVIPFSISYFHGPTDLGIYNIADRIKNVAIQVINPISHSIFPRMSKYYYKDKKYGNKRFIFLITCLFFICGLTYIFSNVFVNNIVFYFTKENIHEVTKILRILLISFIINVFYESFINQYLVVNNLFKQINKGKLILLFCCILIGIPIIFIYGIYGAAMANLIYEIIGLIYVIKIFIQTKNKQIKIT